MKYYQVNNYNQNFLQAASVSVEDSVGLLTLSAVHLPPSFTEKQEQFEDICNTLECGSLQAQTTKQFITTATHFV
jgi:hypothetical protein